MVACTQIEMDKLEGGFPRHGFGKTDTLESVLVLEAEALLNGNRNQLETNGSLSAFSQAEEVNACVVKRFVHERAKDDVLLQWASRICSHGELVMDELQYWEGYEAHDGEAFPDQFQRQLSEDLAHLSQVFVDEEGVDVCEAQHLKDPEGQRLLVQLIEELKELYLGAYESHDTSSKQEFWHVKLEINPPDPCMNFWLVMDELHDDNAVALRLVSALAGDGTVVTRSELVNWEVYYEGPPMVDPAEPDVFQEKLKEWNLRVAAQDLPTECGDVLLMKGGKTCATYPCLYRAPYSSAEVGGTKLLITIELVDADQMAELIDRFNGSVSDASDFSEAVDADDRYSAPSDSSQSSDIIVMSSKVFCGAGEGCARNKMQPRIH
jgi:hypothetical protein